MYLCVTCNEVYRQVSQFHHGDDLVEKCESVFSSIHITILRNPSECWLLVAIILAYREASHGSGVVTPSDAS